MSFLKSGFVTFYVLGVFSCAIDALIHLFSGNFSTAWLGVSLVTLAPSLYYLSLFIHPRARTQRYLNSVIIPIAFGTVLTIIGSINSTSGHTLALTYVILTLFGWILYEFWFSKINRVSSIIKFGETLPIFTLNDHNNQPISSQRLHGIATVLLFFRGNWCPFAYSLIQELVQARKQSEHPIQLVFISSQPSNKMQELATQIKSNALFLVDQQNQLARTFDIEVKFGTPLGLQLFGYYSHIALPSVIMTDEQGKIIYTDIADSFRVYPKPSRYIPLLDQQSIE